MNKSKLRGFRLPASARVPTIVVMLVLVLIARSMPDTCWGGALSEDPLHCYALEEAQKAGLITVEGIYVAGDLLRIYLAEDEWRGEDVTRFLRAKGREFAQRWPERTSYALEHDPCLPDTPAYTDCILEVTFREDGGIDPWDSPHIRIELYTGGADSRFSEGGWASWRQLWPKTGAKPSGAPGAGGFDVSGVDITNFPEVDCSYPYIRHQGVKSCGKWKEYSGFSLTAWISGSPPNPGYIHIKASPGEEAQAAEAALRAEFIRRFGPGGDGGDKIVILPVKYDFGELWRWQLVLRRFRRFSWKHHWNQERPGRIQCPRIRGRQKHHIPGRVEPS